MHILPNIRLFCLLTVLGLLPLHLFGQLDHAFALGNKAGIRIEVDTTISENSHFEIFDSQMSISGLAFSGDIVLHSDSSLVRIILMDANFNEYLIYEAYPILSGSRQFSVKGAGEETILLDRVTPYRVSIDLVSASVYLKEFSICDEDGHKSAARDELRLRQSRYKIDRINENIQDLNQAWVAGETSISKLTYQQKLSMFGGRVPNFQGFEYYIGGVFVSPGALSEGSATKSASSEDYNQEQAPYPDEFSWRHRHGTDWLTPVKNQTSCKSCFAFASIAAAELLVNLYFNRHLDYDLSEQNIISCTGGSCEDGGSANESLDLLIHTGIVLEDCFPYTASDQDCSENCENPSERIKVAKWEFNYNEQDFKREIIAGAVAAKVFAWYHFVHLIGYKVIKAGDKLYKGQYDSTSYITIEPNSPLIGQTAWLCKNSWGESWGNNGLGYFIVDIGNISLYSLKGPVESMTLNDSDIRCADHDGDGYYCWGIGRKPAHCPDSPDEADGDDSNRCIGPLDEFGNFTFTTPTPEAKDSVILVGSPPDLYINGSSIRWYNDMGLQNLVHEGELFSTGQTETGKYTYYATQTIAACESAADAVSLSILTEIPRPTGHDTVLNIRELAVLTVEGEQGAVFKWYEDSLLSILSGIGDYFEPVNTDAGTYTYYVSQTLGSLESTPDTVLLTLLNINSVPDTAFLNALIDNGVDVDGDRLISNEEAEALSLLDVSGNDIIDMTGIEAFVNLESLICSNNTRLKRLDVSNSPALTMLNCSNNLLGRLDVSNNPALVQLNCSSNQLYSLDVSNNPALRQLNCSNNPRVWRLDVSNNPALTHLNCCQNHLFNLDVSNNPALIDLKCGANQISALDISCNTQLGKGNPYVELFCALDFCDMPTLTNVCVWETFHQESIPIFTTGSDNFQFSYSCGTCSSIGTNDDYLSGLSIFPIPCHDILNIETGISDLYKIEVSSLNGQLIFVRIVEGPTHQLDLSSFQNGVYFITINLKDFVTTRKIIKL